MLALYYFSRFVGTILTRALLGGGGGGLNAPLRFFEDSENTAARGAAVFGLNCVSLGESAAGVQNCAPRGNFIVFSLLPSSSDTLGLRDPKFGTRVHVSKGQGLSEYA